MANEKNLKEKVQSISHNWKQANGRVGIMPMEKGKTYSIDITNPFDETASYDAIKTIEGANISVAAFCRRGNGLDFERKETTKETFEAFLLSEAEQGNEVVTFTVINEIARRTMYNGVESITHMYTLQRV